MRGPDPLQVEVARLVLSVADRYGVALGGGLALVLHGVVDRPTEDIDAFTNSDSGVRPAAEAVEAALRQAGFTTQAVNGHSDIAEVIDDMDQYMVEWELRRGDHVVRLSVSCLARLRAPVMMDLGPVMDLEDLIAWKVAALVGRARERDYIDVAAMLDTHTPAELLAMARRVDPGLEDEDIPAVGRRLDRLPDEAFVPYRLGSGDVAQLRHRFAVWPR